MRSIRIAGCAVLLAVAVPVWIMAATAPAQSSDLLTLEDSVALALERNPEVLIAGDRLAASEAMMREARGAFLPSAYAEASYMRIDEAPTVSIEDIPFDLGPGMDSFELSPTESYEAGFRAEQVLFAGGRILGTYRAAQAGRTAAARNLDAARNRLAYQVKKAYYTVLLTRRLRDVARHAATLLDAHLQDVTRYLEVGIVARVDLLRTEVEKADADQQLNRSQNAVDLAESAFNNLLNRSLDTDVEIEDVLAYEPVAMTLEDATSTGLTDRPELAAAAEMVSAADRRLSVARGEYLPTVALSGTYSWNKGTQLEIQGEDWHWTVGVTGRLTLWDGAAREARVSQAKAEQRRAVNELEKTRNAVSLEVREAYLQIRDAEKNVAVAAKAVTSAEESYRISKLRYETGAGTNTDVLDAHTALARAEGNHYQALYDYDVAVARLRYAMGSR